MLTKELVERKQYSDFLARNTNKNIALLGRKKSGKTVILKEHLNKLRKSHLAVYIDLEKTSLTPESFSVEFVGNIMFNLLGKKTYDYKNFLKIDNLIQYSSSLSSNCAEILKQIENELLKIKPDQRALVENAFRFAELIGKEKKAVIFLDNFENILDLNNFSQIKDIISLINFENKDVKYVVASSLISQFKDLRNFEVIEVKNLEKNEAADLIRKFIGKADKKVVDEIYYFSKGNAFIIKSLTLKYKEINNVKKAFLTELLCKDGLIYNYCKENLNFYLNLARGQTLLKNILKAVSQNEFRLSEVAREIYRSAPITKAMIERLVVVDLISKKDSKFYFEDSILQLWVKLTAEGYDFDFVPEDNVLEDIEL